MTRQWIEKRNGESVIERSLIDATEVVREQFGEIDGVAGAILIGAVLQSEGYQRRTEMLAMALSELDASLSEISLVIDEVYNPAMGV